MQASTRASLTSSILSWAISMNSPSAAACAVATISMSGATGIVREISRAPVESTLIRADSRPDISGASGFAQRQVAREYRAALSRRVGLGIAKTAAAGGQETRGSPARASESHCLDLKTQEDLERADDGRRDQARGEECEHGADFRGEQGPGQSASLRPLPPRGGGDAGRSRFEGGCLRSFHVRSSRGKASPLPRPGRDGRGEQALAIEGLAANSGCEHGLSL